MFEAIYCVALFFYFRWCVSTCFA